MKNAGVMWSFPIFSSSTLAPPAHRCLVHRSSPARIPSTGPPSALGFLPLPVTFGRLSLEISASSYFSSMALLLTRSYSRCYLHRGTDRRNCVDTLHQGVNVD